MNFKLSALKPFKRERGDIAGAYVRIFNSEDGLTVLQHLHDITAFRTADPVEPESVLRHREGQRALLLQIVRMIETGRKQ
jgi:hypothetical protein